MKRLFILAMAVACSAAFAQTNLYSNQSSNVNVAQLNAVTTAVAGQTAPSGGYWSEVQNDSNTTANTTAGFSLYTAGTTPTFRVADDFIVGGAGWTVTGLKVYGYQTGSTGLPFNGGSLNIWSGRPGDAGANIIGTGTWTGGTDIIQVDGGGATGNVFRIFNTWVSPTGTNPGTAPGTTRRLWENTFTLPNLNLSAGTYWIDFALNTTNAGSAFGPSTTHAGLRGVAGANARQYTVSSSTWADMMDAGQGVAGSFSPVQQELPFIVQGTPVPEPASMAVIGLGALALLRRRRR